MSWTLGFGCFMSHDDRFAIKFRNTFLELLDLNEQVFFDVRKVLVGARRRPQNIQADDLRIRSKADVLLQRVAAERTCLSNRAPDGTLRFSMIPDCHLDSCAD